MNSHLRKIAQQAARNIDLAYPGDAYPSALVKLIVADLQQEFSKIKWAGQEDGWDKAIKAIAKEISHRYSNI